MNRSTPAFERLVKRLPAHCFLALALGALAGCSDEKSGTTVSGVVTLNGNPLPQGTIAFRKEGSAATGTGIKSDGSYSLQVEPGEYQVRVDASGELPANWKEGDPPPPRLVPDKFASFETSGLTANVGEESSQDIDFALP